MAIFDDLSAKQIAALSVVAFGGESASLHKWTAKSLVKLGLIEPYEDKIPVPPLGEMTITRYATDFSTHVAFCEWCAKQADNEEEYE